MMGISKNHLHKTFELHDLTKMNNGLPNKFC